MRRIAFALAVWAIALFPAAATACSVVDGYRVPTNLELVGQADVILRGRVTGEIGGEGPWDRSLLVEPLETLKGDLPSGTVVIPGSGLVPQEDERGFGIISNPYELADAHPLSYIGGCIRYMFPEGTIVLFFLEQREGKWQAAGGPFSRWAEDVVDTDAPWTVLTRFYASLQDADPAKRKALLEAERDRLLARESDPVADLMARDVERQLAGPNEEWNTIMQRAIDGEAEVPEGAAAEVAAEAVASLIMEEAVESTETSCFTEENGDMVCEAEVTGYADAMEEEEALLLCGLSVDGQSVDCDGVTYFRVQNIEDAGK